MGVQVRARVFAATVAVAVAATGAPASAQSSARTRDVPRAGSSSSGEGESGGGGGGGPSIVRPSTRRFWAHLGLGPSLLLVSSTGLGGGTASFRLNEQFGFHFNNSGAGPALAIDLFESFGGGAFGFEAGPRFLWDIQPVSNLAVYIAPSAGLNFALLTGGGVTYAGLSVQLGLDLRVVLADRGLLFFRFPGFSVPILFNSFGTAAGFSWDIFLIGGGVTF